MTAFDEVAQRIATLIAESSAQAEWYRVVSGNPLLLDQIDGDGIIDERDEDVEVADSVLTHRATHGFTAGEVVLVLRTPDGWVILDAQTGREVAVATADSTGVSLWQDVSAIYGRVAGGTLAGDYTLAPGETGVVMAGVAGPEADLIYIDGAEEELAGRTEEFRLNVVTAGNATALGVTLTAFLWEVTAVAGGSLGVTHTLADSGLSAVANKAASGLRRTASDPVAVAGLSHDPGFYALGFRLSGRTATNSQLDLAVRLQRRYT